MKRQVLFILLFCFVTFSSQSIFSQEKLIPKDSLLADFDTLFTSINDIHVNMFANISKKDFYRKADSIKSLINKDMTSSDFFILVAPLVANIGDGHTNLYLSNETINNNPSVFPYGVKIDENDSIIKVTSNFGISGNNIPPNSIITKINGVPSKKIIGKMMRYCSGERYFFKLVRVNYYFRHLLYAMNKDSVFNINYRYNNEEKLSVCKGIPYSELLEHYYKTKESKNKKANFSFKVLKDKNTGLIDFKSFNDLDKFKIFLDSVFTIMKNKYIGNLIIDIRKNGGGNSLLGDELFQYISPSPFIQFGKTIVKTSEKQKAYYLKHYAGNWSKKRLKRFKKRKTGIKTFNNRKLIKLRKNKLRYHGNVFLLISHYTFSSAASFSWVFKYLKMGKVIGEESGGMAVCFGDGISVNLPYSKLSCSISFKKFYQYGATDNDIHGTIPDYQVREDKALDYALKLIDESQ